jgi:hypothetical protein
MSIVRNVKQHIEDIEIPVIEITEGWAAEDCKTLDQCDDAFAYLMSAVAGIEFQIDMEATKPETSQDKAWLARAKCALKFKRAALQIVNQRRAVINAEASRAFQSRRDSKLLQHIRSIVPDHQFMDWIRGSGIAHETQDAA